MKNLAIALKSLLLCPPTVPQSIGASTCLERFGEIQKIILQRTLNGAVTNSITIATSNPNLLATWTAFLIAGDDTKAQVTPFINALINEVGDPIQIGGVGATVGGIVKNIGSNASPFNGEFHDEERKVMADVKVYNKEKALSVFLLNEHGDIGGLTDNLTTPTIFKGIPCLDTFFLTDKKFGGKADVDKDFVSWSFLPNWSDKFYVVTAADFNPVSDLINP
ncbi:MAG: putative structural protein [Prokaryotic dsDNA virus sp.]|mgnify:CR=1 FL=1|nr:MAG: putative structural protein [Prokaryotic dsDNA virus sp.]|tara:strand:- start:7296 stop:7958 length:663 start_codon:yes stop_codon:yes gene_type:complete